MGVSRMTELNYNPYEIGERLSIMRGKNKLSQEEAASRMGISRNALSKYENGINKMSAEVIVKFAKIYGTSVDYLLSGVNIEVHRNIDNDIMMMLEGYTPKQLKALMGILKGIQDICNGAA